MTMGEGPLRAVALKPVGCQRDSSKGTASLFPVMQKMIVVLLDKGFIRDQA